MGTETHSAPFDEESTADAVFARRFCRIWIPWSCGCSSSAPSSVEWWQNMKVSETGDKRRHAAVCGWRSRGRSAVMMVREWSELLAGPWWKTFIRRLKGNPRHGCGVMRTVKSSSFQYSPLSYALNFDEGHGGSSEGTAPATATSPPASPSRRLPVSRPWTSPTGTSRRSVRRWRRSLRSKIACAEEFQEIS